MVNGESYTYKLWINENKFGGPQAIFPVRRKIER